jgi:competence protein ComEC
MRKNSEEKPKFKNFLIFIFVLFFAADMSVWQQVLFGKYSDEPRIHFLDVGQGDSELVVFPGNVKIITDAGPDSKITGELDKIPSLYDKYIDIAVITHPQLDHFNGFSYLLDKYRIGAFIYNGRSDSSEVQEWPELVDKIKERHIPLIILGAGDKIRYSGNKIDFLSPNPEFVQSAELNDTGLVEMIELGGVKVLLTADIGVGVENYLVNRFNIEAEILKVAHHGSKYSSSPAFLESVKPKVAIIEAGAHNNYGHPASVTLKNISNLASVLRTDKNGQITVSVSNGKLKVFISK